MAVIYEYWRHKATLETYAVRLDGDRVTGIFPLPPSARLNRSALPHYAYDTDPDTCRRLEERGGEFLLAG